MILVQYFECFGFRFKIIILNSIRPRLVINSIHTKCIRLIRMSNKILLKSGFIVDLVVSKMKEGCDRSPLKMCYRPLRTKKCSNQKFLCFKLMPMLSRSNLRVMIWTPFTVKPFNGPYWGLQS